MNYYDVTFELPNGKPETYYFIEAETERKAKYAAYKKLYGYCVDEGGGKPDFRDYIVNAVAVRRIVRGAK